ncbi:sugar ABC transporter substrate-binding protein [Pseudoclostridium thermosuccinogenes]|uniref:ABC transporter substrate-binding protein n=1 Tax=Clostridium thermosuccinogenes TaxID=84032 RepID=UPI002FD90B85
MIKSKKILACLLALSMMSLSLVACGGKDTSSSSSGNSDSGAAASTETSSTETSKTNSSSSGERVTVTTSLGEGELSADLVAEFEAEHPNIKIEFVVLDDAKLAAQLATGTAPDVLRVSGAFDTAAYAIKGIAMDLTERIENSELIDLNDLLPIANVYRFDGKKVGQGPIYGLPKDWSNDFALFYNKRCFEAAGVEVPDESKALTWPEVMELAKKLTIMDGDQVVQYGLAANEWGQTHANFNLLMQYLASAGVSLSSDDFKSVNFDQQPVRDFITMWVDAVKSGVGPSALNNDQTSGGDLFLSDRAALMINGYWYSGVIRGNADTQTHLDDFGMLPTPIAPGGNRVAATGGATGCVIYKGTKHPDEAWTFFEWVFAGKPADERAKTGWGMPIFKSKLSLLPQETNFDKQVYNVLQDEMKYQNDFLAVNPYLAGGGWGIFEKYYVPLLFDQETIDGAIEGMTKDANVVITEAINALSN